MRNGIGVNVVMFNERACLECGRSRFRAKGRDKEKTIKNFHLIVWNIKYR